MAHKMDKYIFCLFVCISVVCGHEEQRKTEEAKNHLGSDIGLTYKFHAATDSLIRYDDKPCTQFGLMCEDCTKVSYCIYMPGGYWLKEDMDDCPAATTCQEATGTCSAESNPSCEASVPGYEFICQQPGIFPDPFDCQRYHMCTPGNRSPVEKTSIKMKCDDSYYYDPLSTLCRKKMENGKCPAIIPKCSKLAQNGPVAKNPSLYYICLKTGTELFPQIFTCPNNEFYNEVVKSCRDPTPTSHGTCDSIGLFYNPDNCKQYVKCSAVGGSPLYTNCAEDGTKFYNPLRASCQSFACSDLKDRW